MNQYDPHRGWVDAVVSNHLDTAPEPDAGVPRHGGEEGPAGLVDVGTVNAGRAAVFHFSRDGRRLKVKNEDLEVVGTNAATVMPEVAQACLNGSGLLALSGVVTELFATLSEDEKLSPQVSDVVESMRCLAEKVGEKKRLEDELAAVTAQIVIVEQVLHRHVRLAHESEIRALATRQARVELMRELADCIMENKDLQKPV